MDELNVLREMRAEAPEGDAGRLRPARERLLAAAGGAGPVRRARPASPGRLWSGAHRGTLLAGSACAAAVVALAAVQLGQTGSPAGEGGASTASTASTASAAPTAAERYADTAVVLEQAALVAESRPVGAAPRPDQWQYRRYVTVQPGDGERREHEEWIRYDGRQTAGHDWEGGFRVRDVPPDPGDDDLSPERYAEKLRRLPTDPDGLLAHVRGDRHWIDLPAGEGSRGAEHPDVRAFRVLSLYLKQGAVMPPELEAAIYRALARIPGVTVETGVRDAAGRVGLGLVHTPSQHQEMRRYLILQPDTFRYLGDRMVWLRDKVIGGEVAFPAGSVFATAELASAIVDRPGQRS
ncbi:CU044_5270 family protein [Planomonospora corallina]|uniref:CU044_5270 family protein n=1 Tax=Planomonospora corallina TaxID=1806052 RepID=A0ABV8IC11_9ACTN